MTVVTRRGVLVGAVGAGAAAVAGVGAATPAEASPRHTRTVKIYLARHGQTWLNLVDRVQGWSDAPLTAVGEQTATNVGKGLAAEAGRFDAAYSADMVRHFSTASFMLQGARSRLTPTRVQALREVAFGGFEGSLNEEMWGAVLAKVGYPTLPDAIAAGMTIVDLVDVIPTVNPVSTLLAETSAAVGNRMYDALDRIARREEREHGRGNVLVVSSGLSITCLLFKLGAGDRVPASGLANGAVNLLEYRSGRWTVKTVNDTHYAG